MREIEKANSFSLEVKRIQSECGLFAAFCDPSCLSTSADGSTVPHTPSWEKAMGLQTHKLAIHKKRKSFLIILFMI